MKIYLPASILFCMLLCNCNNQNVPSSAIVKVEKPTAKDTLKVKKDSEAVPKPIKSDTVLTPEHYKSYGYDSIGFELIDSENIGGVKSCLSMAKTLELLGRPDKKSKPEKSEVDGEVYEAWEYTNKGVLLNMSLTRGAIGDFAISPPCVLRTKRRIGIGSSTEEVYRAYRIAIDTTYHDSLLIIAGTAYGGMQFTLKNNKVTEIFIGATAE